MDGEYSSVNLIYFKYFPLKQKYIYIKKYRKKIKRMVKKKCYYPRPEQRT